MVGLVSETTSASPDRVNGEGRSSATTSRSQPRIGTCSPASVRHRAGDHSRRARKRFITSNVARHVRLSGLSSPKASSTSSSKTPARPSVCNRASCFARQGDTVYDAERGTCGAANLPYVAFVSRLATSAGVGAAGELAARLSLAFPLVLIARRAAMVMVPTASRRLRARRACRTWRSTS